MNAAAWQRLADDLAAAGVAVSITARPYVEAVYGRVVHGTSRSITLRHADGGLVQVADRFNRADGWVGWEVFREDAEGITGRTWRATKMRSEVVAAVREALAT